MFLLFWGGGVLNKLFSYKGASYEYTRFKVVKCFGIKSSNVNHVTQRFGSKPVNRFVSLDARTDYEEDIPKQTQKRIWIWKKMDTKKKKAQVRTFLLYVILLDDLFYPNDLLQQLRGLLYISQFYYETPSLRMSVVFFLQRHYFVGSFQFNNFCLSFYFYPNLYVTSLLLKLFSAIC